MDYIKVLLPLLTFALAIIFVPYIERRKDSAKAKKIHGFLMTELQDESALIPDRLEKMARCLGNLKCIKEGKYERGPVKYVPRETALYFLKPAMDLSFDLFTRDQRDAMKSLVAQVSALELYLNEIKSIGLPEDNVDKLIDCCKRYLYTGASALNTMRIVSGSSRAIKGEDKYVIGGILLEYKISAKYEDLIIRRSCAVPGGEAASLTPSRTRRKAEHRERSRRR